MTMPDFDRFTALLLNTLRERQARYGTRNITGPAGVLARVEDKVARLRQSVRDGQFDSNDWMDLAGYGAVGWLLQIGLWDERSALRRVYFAHPHPPDRDCDRYADALSKVFAVYRPVGPFLNVAGHAGWVWPVCLKAIDLADMLVGYLPEKSPGVSAEMLYAKTLGKTVWVLAPAAETAESSLVQFCADRLFIHPERFLEEVKGYAVPARQEAPPTVEAFGV